MSPLLYQLSYTARAAKLTTYGDRVKRGVGTVPENVPANHLARCVLQIGGRDNVIPIEDRARSVTGDSHTHDFRDTRTNEVSRGGAAEVMPQHSRESRCFTRAGPALPEIADPLTLEVTSREVWKEIGNDSTQLSREGAYPFELLLHQHPDFG